MYENNPPSAVSISTYPACNRMLAAETGATSINGNEYSELSAQVTDSNPLPLSACPIEYHTTCLVLGGLNNYSKTVIINFKIPSYFLHR